MQFKLSAVQLLVIFLNGFAIFVAVNYCDWSILASNIHYCCTCDSFQHPMQNLYIQMLLQILLPWRYTLFFLWKSQKSMFWVWIIDSLAYCLNKINYSRGLGWDEENCSFEGYLYSNCETKTERQNFFIFQKWGKHKLFRCYLVHKNIFMSYLVYI